MEELRQASTRISDEGKRAGAIGERIRALTRKAPPSREPLLINDVVLDVLSLIGAEAQKYQFGRAGARAETPEGPR